MTKILSTSLTRAEQSVARSLWVSLAAVFAGSLVLTLSAKIQVPFYPVPMTLQTLALAVICLAYGTRLAVATVLVYLAQGALGVPVFAGAVAGLPYLLGPTGGYLMGFIPAALLLGYAGSRMRSRPEPQMKQGLRLLPLIVMLAVILAAYALVYACGYAWLGFQIGYEKAFWLGVAPFVLGDLAKAALAAVSLQIGCSLAVRIGLLSDADKK